MVILYGLHYHLVSLGLPAQVDQSRRTANTFVGHEKCMHCWMHVGPCQFNAQNQGLYLRLSTTRF